MKINPTEIADVLLFEPDVYKDGRGYFMELYNQSRYLDLGFQQTFVQDNYSVSSKGTLRGLHYQLNTPQGKLVQVLEGEVFDVALDIRKGSPTFGQHISRVLSESNHHQLYIPPGFAHGFCVLSDTVRFMYKCTGYYDPADQHGIYWADEALNIAWPADEPLLSDKDKVLPKLADVAPDKLDVFKN